MAANLLETLKLEITCPLCLDIFSQPKKLPCEHVYCEECLRGLVAAKTASNTLSCPECRQTFPVSDFSTFSTPYHINRLIEMYERGVHEAGESTDGASKLTGRVGFSGDTSRGGVMPANLHCAVHKSKSLALYCESCQKLVCNDCILFSCAKQDHSYGYIEDVFDKHKSALSDKLYPVRELHQRMAESLQTTHAFEKDLEREEEKVVQEINSAFKGLLDVLKEEKYRLKRNVSTKFQDAKLLNSLRKQEVEKVSTELEKVIKTISSTHQHGSPARFLAHVKTSEGLIDEVIKSTLKVQSPHPVKVPTIGLNVLGADKLREVCRESTYHFQKDDPLKCHFEAGVDWNNIPHGTPCSVTLYLDTEKKMFRSPKLEALLCCVSTGKQQYVDVVRITSQSFRLVMKPESRGRHELRVKYNDEYISESPIRLHVAMKVSKLRQSSPCAVSTLDQPMGVKCSEGCVYVSELSSGLAMLEARTIKKVRSLWMPDVWEVSLDTKSNRMYGTDNKRHTVKMMSMDGQQVLKTVGGSGSNPGQFRYPNGIRCSKDGEVFVCDTMNNRIQVFDKNLNLLRVIEHNILGIPDDLDFDEDGNLYIANQSNHNIAVFTPEGTFLRTIGKLGSELGNLDNPISVAIHRGLVYVTDCHNGRISVFTTTGRFVTVFGEGALRKPECVAIDEDGYVYVSDQRMRLYVF